SWQVLQELPLTPNGKIDRQALARSAGLPGSTPPGREYVAPRTETETEIARIWSEVLGVEQVSVEENFFALGGHSLLATQVVSRLRQQFGVELALRLMFEAPTVARLAAAIGQSLSEQEDKNLTNVETIARGKGNFNDL